MAQQTLTLRVTVTVDEEDYRHTLQQIPPTFRRVITPPPVEQNVPEAVRAQISQLPYVHVVQVALQD